MWLKDHRPVTLVGLPAFGHPGVLMRHKCRWRCLEGPRCVVQGLCGLGLSDLLGGPGGGELGGGEAAVGRVGTVLVVVDAPVPDEHSGLEEAVELPQVQQLVA